MRMSLLSALLLSSTLILSQPVLAQDAADLVVRTNRLENMVRQLSGQIEQLQFENRRLQDQVKRFQEDVDFRLQEKNGAPRQQAPQRRGDAFDPASGAGTAGAPRPLGAGVTTGAPPQGLAGQAPSSTPAAGMNASGRGVAQGGTYSVNPNRPAGANLPGGVGIIDDDDAGPGQPLDINTLARRGAGNSGVPDAGPRVGPSIAATASTTPRETLDNAVAHYRAKQYEQAEMTLRQLLQSHPRDRLVPDALYWLGESYAARQRHREAAEQFLKVTTDHAKSARAPDSLLKLGVSLNALGAKEQACATFAEAGRKFAQEAGSYRQRVDRERTRARCVA
jgi:tol-pal system protein YbgF